MKDILIGVTLITQVAMNGVHCPTSIGNHMISSAIWNK